MIYEMEVYDAINGFDYGKPIEFEQDFADDSALVEYATERDFERENTVRFVRKDGKAVVLAFNKAQYAQYEEEEEE